jgi:acetyltransferase-like isoleucine patch superfamily enzyme
LSAKSQSERPPDAESIKVHPTALCESEEVGPGTRIWAYAHVLRGARIGANCNIGDHAYIEGGASLGDNVTLKNGVMVWEGVHIASGAFIGPGVVFTNDQFPRSPRLEHVPRVIERYADKTRWLVRTHVGVGVAIGAGAVIGPGVVLGDYALVGAGSVVTRDVEPFRLVVGNPAKPLGWVCRMGSRLVPSAGDALRCTACGREIGSPALLRAGEGC